MEKQLTAVEWLENEFQEMCKDFGGLHTDFIERFNQAKEMEKEQIINAYHINPLESKWKNIGEQYYNETYKSE